MSGYIAAAKSVDHGTPLEVAECARRAFRCRRFDLDPAASKRHKSIDARKVHYGPECGHIDGAAVKWHGRTYSNPPYGREIPRWTARARVESEAGRANVIQLLPFRAANWFLNDILGGASMMCAIRGRLVFLGSIDPYPVDSLVVLWGDEYRESFYEAFGAFVPRSKVCRAESVKAAKKAGRKNRRVKWVRLTRPLGVVVDLKMARAGRQVQLWLSGK